MAYEPLDRYARKWFENNFLWLIQEFPEPDIQERKIMCPVKKDFPVNFDGTEDSARAALQIVAGNMQLDPESVDLDFYDNPEQEINMGNMSIFMQNSPETPGAAGLYYGKDETGKYLVDIDRSILKKPQKLIAVLAHELSHAKLLGGKILPKNDEYITDLAVAFFGFGIFTSNSSFEYYQTNYKWGYEGGGYLRQDQWAYALALMAFIRPDDDLKWAEYLNKTIRKDFDRCLDFMMNNRDDIFYFSEEDGEEREKRNDENEPVKTIFNLQEEKVMTHEERLKFCRICTNQKLDNELGIVCGLTGRVAVFEKTCPDFAEDFDEQLMISTSPIKELLLFKIARKGTRFANFILDRIFITVITYVIAYFLGTYFPGSVRRILASGNERMWDIAIGLVLTALYYFVFEAGGGRTIGKMFTKTRVVTEDGRIPELRDIALRTMCRFIPFDPFTFLGNDESGWHDHLSKTMVINDN